VGARRRAVEAVELTGSSVLVTGADGFIGSWLVEALLDAGARVVALRRDEPALTSLALLGLAERVEVVPGDIRDLGLLAEALRKHEVEGVFHLAAQTLVGPASRSPVATFETNIRGTWTMLEACRLAGVRRVLVASSDKAYGPSSELPYREGQALAPVYPYDVSKAACDMLARSYWHTFELPAAVIRLANVYGGADTNRSRLIPEAVCAALSGTSPVIRSDGSPQRDFLYVDDAVRAYLGVWAALGRGEGRGEAYNAGGGVPHRVLDVASLVCRIVGGSIEPDVRGVGVPRGEIDRQWVDFTKLRELTGWEPQVALEDGLERTVRWYRSHPETWMPS
jgi:CDP-glucose 4,6-dehydratase